ncbi:MAG TPA: ComEA family DNA-binding protein [Dermatophilaceae bacterium]|nr:ComEA family DNA-binding protein [Dermatophilaceae bacterium]
MFRRRACGPSVGWAALLRQPDDDQRPPPATVGRWTPEFSADASEPARTGSGRHRDPAAGPLPVSVPAHLARPRTRPTWWAVLGVAIVLVVAAGVFATRAARAGTAATPTPVAPVRPVTTASPVPGVLVPGSARPADPGVAGSAAGSAGGPATGVLMVHVVGQVARPGVVRLPVGARVMDAVGAAGGSLKGADMSRVNLARMVVDGEQLLLPARGSPAGSSDPAVPGPPGQARPTAAVPGVATGLVDLNTATVAGLEGLPGIGPVLAARIVGWRVQNGRFTTVEELAEIPGIGERMLDRLRPLVRV